MTHAPAQRAIDDTWVPTHCSMCYHGCPILVHRVNGVAVKIEGHHSTHAATVVEAQIVFNERCRR